MTHFKCMDGNYIRSVGKSEKPVFVEITAEEYAKIKAIMAEKPTTPSGFNCRLKADLTWELYELPQLDDDPELNAEEALSIILGGETDA